MNFRGFGPNLIVAGTLIIGSFLLQGCGQNKQVESGGESFATTTMEATVNGTENNLTSNAVVNPPLPSAEPSVVPVETSAPPAEASGLTASGSEGKSVKPPELPSPEPVIQPLATPATTQAVAPEVTAKVTANATSNTTAKVTAAASTTATPKPVQPTASPSAKPAPKLEPTVKAASTTKPERLGVTGIGWSDFFDGEDQTRPSERFWDLHGSQVTIKGFMGEVLSFEKNWFLLIPEPGAECPFDNGDETYWNKIMIVFVPEDVKLRYKSAPLQITGRLDVGIKIDESGYKTMFRLYDASFKEIQ